MQCASPLDFLVHKKGAVFVLPHPDGLGLAVGCGLARHGKLVVPFRARSLRLARERQAAGRKPQLLLQRGEARPQMRLVLGSSASRIFCVLGSVRGWFRALSSAATAASSGPSTAVSFSVFASLQSVSTRLANW